MAESVQLGTHPIPFRLSVDHHVHVTSERERIQSSGGNIIVSSVPRVEGFLAISRTLGDFDLADKGVIWKPHIRIVPNFAKMGKFMIMASDGIWELIDEDNACGIVYDEISFGELQRNDFKSSNTFDGDFEPEDLLRESTELKHLFNRQGNESEFQAARSLIEHAYERHSTDNMSVIILSWQ
jgi:serine/threonine protein phosphatase PrpC